MVVKASPKPANPDSGKSGVLNIFPSTLSEVRESPHKKFILLCTTSRCPPCKMLKSWLSTYEPSALIPVYHIPMDESSDLSSTVATLYSISSVPKLIITNNTLEAKEIFNGFNEDGIKDLLKKHFETK